MYTNAIISTILAGAGATASAAALPRATTTDFRLRTKVTAYDLTPSINDRPIGYVATSDTEASLVVLNTDYTTGSVFFPAGGQSINARGYTGLPGTGVVNPGILITPGGTATVPSPNIVHLDKEAFTPQIVYQGGSLQYRDGAFTACPLNVLDYETDDETVVISYKQDGQRTLAGCADVTLQVEFVEE